MMLICKFLRYQVGQIKYLALCVNLAGFSVEKVRAQDTGYHGKNSNYEIVENGNLEEASEGKKKQLPSRMQNEIQADLKILIDSTTEAEIVGLKMLAIENKLLRGIHSEEFPEINSIAIDLLQKEYISLEKSKSRQLAEAAEYRIFSRQRQLKHLITEDGSRLETLLSRIRGTAQDIVVIGNKRDNFSKALAKETASMKKNELESTVADFNKSLKVLQIYLEDTQKEILGNH